MKYLAIFLILSILFSLSLQTCKEMEGSSGKDCKKHQLDKDEQKEDELKQIPDSCCYLTGKGIELQGCSHFKKDKIKDYIKLYEKMEGVSDISIDCSGKFLGLASGLLILLLLA